MRIALLDLNHKTRGVHTNTVPLGIGLIAEYTKRYVNGNYEIRLFKEHDKILNILDEWVPDLIGLAQYSWNSELNYYVASKIKGINKDCVVIAGGPNLDHDKEKRIEYLKNYKNIDALIQYDGELPFSEIVKRLDMNFDVIKLRQQPVTGAYSLDPYDSEKLNECFEPSETLQVKSNEEMIGRVEFRRITGHDKKLAPRLDSLDFFGAMYADRKFDEFLDAGYHPFVQTHRGCPFSCTFCHTSDKYYNKVRFLSPEIFERDMEYLGKRYSGMDHVKLYIANTNMSLFNEDFEIAKIIRNTKIKYGWPVLIDVNSGRNPDKLLKMIEIIDFKPGIATQTLTPEVLNNIKRKNIPYAKFEKFQQSIVNKLGVASQTELIMPLPGETYSSFMKTIETILDSSIQQIVIYTLMKLKGTPLADDEMVNKYNYNIKYRVVPGQFSKINNDLVMDYEEVVVGTNTLSFDEYVDLRGLAIVITVFASSVEIKPIRKILREKNIKISEWIFKIHKNIKNYSALAAEYNNYLNETRNELFDSYESFYEHFRDDFNYEQLLTGNRGSNLISKYKKIFLTTCFLDVIDLALFEAKHLLSKDCNRYDMIIPDIRKYVLSHNIMEIITGININKDNRIELNFDVPSWFEDDTNKTIDEYFKKTKYVIKYLSKTYQKFNMIREMNQDLDLSLQHLIRDNKTVSYWPEWVRLE